MPKYLIKAKIEIDGIVEKPDVIGAIFGQTEGLFGEQFDLRQLQDKGRIGRITVDLKTHGTRSMGEIIIPSNLDRVETALIAAMIESVDKVGPYPARIEVIDIIDVRLEKIKKIVERAKEILSVWSRQKGPDLKNILQEIETVLKTPEVIKYGPEQLPAGPDVERSDTLIVVEGRADVINLLRYGYKNVVAIGGARTRIPQSIINLSKRKKKVIVFLDGDHAGDLILKELLRSNMKIDYIARAPPNKEVEELTSKEIRDSLSSAVSVREYIEQQKRRYAYREAKEKMVEEAKEKPTRKALPELEETLTLPTTVTNDIKSLIGTLEGILYDKDWNKIKRLPVRNLVNELNSTEVEQVNAIVFDGIITQRLIDAAKDKNVKIIIGTKLGNINYKPSELILLTFNDLL